MQRLITLLALAVLLIGSDNAWADDPFNDNAPLAGIGSDDISFFDGASHANLLSEEVRSRRADFVNSAPRTIWNPNTPGRLCGPNFLELESCYLIFRQKFV